MNEDLNEPTEITIKDIDKFYHKLMTDEFKKIEDALDMAIRYGGIDGEHHKTWVIDQIVRILAGEKYEELIRESCDGVDGPNTYDWDVGIAP